MKNVKRATLILAALVLFVARPVNVRAGLALTSEGQAAGFGLSTFATGFPVSEGIGPIGVAFPGVGEVLVGDFSGNVRLFSDTDGQIASSVPVAQNYGNGNVSGMAQVGGNIYMTQAANSDVVQINANGTFDQLIATAPNVGFQNVFGPAIDPANGDIFASQSSTGGQFNQILDINAATKSLSIFSSGTTYTGQIVFNPSGSIFYAVTDYPSPNSNAVTGFDAHSGATVFGPVFFPGISNGVALGTGSLADDLFVNTQDGQLIELNLTTLSQTVIASGGAGGFQLYADPNNNSLLVTQLDSVYRLTAPSDGGFFAPEAVPEPSTFTLFGAGTAFLLGYNWRRRKLPCLASRATVTTSAGSAASEYRL